MNIIDKVTNSRGTLKEILSGEWNTNTIPELSNIEIEKIYNIPSSKNKSIAQFGIASGCNFSLEHRFIKPYNYILSITIFQKLEEIAQK